MPKNSVIPIYCFVDMVSQNPWTIEYLSDLEDTTSKNLYLPLKLSYLMSKWSKSVLWNNINCQNYMICNLAKRYTTTKIMPPIF